MPLFQENKSLSTLSTFGIGGNAKYLVEVHSILQMQEVIRHCLGQNLPYHVIGKGSNCLFDDLGFDGVIILNKISFLQIEKEEVFVGAGYSFSLLGSMTAQKGLSGLEFASGIPGSVGGAIFMNAGACGTETCQTLVEVTFVDAEGEIQIFSNKELAFSYRYSSFQEKKGGIVSAKFFLEPRSTASQKRIEMIKYRTKTQPYREKSCGCTFCNPKEFSAGQLIEKCGLKGKKIGDAEVSVVHGNFIINKGKATAKDVLLLVQEIQEIVKQKTGIELKTELRVIPFQ